MADLLQPDIWDALHYSPETGIFTWLKGQRRGHVAGSVNNFGYHAICFRKKSYLAHRLAWLYMSGHWPENFVDHIDRDKLNNRIANLRLAGRSGNSANTGIRRDNVSGAKGVWWSKARQKFEVRVKCHGKVRFVGRFDDVKVAAAAYDRAAAEAFGEFAAPSMGEAA